MPYGTIGCTYHQLKYSSPNCSNKQTKDKSHTKEPTFQKMEVWIKTDQETGPKAEQDKTEIATWQGRRTREDIEKWDQTGSSAIPDRGETLEIPQPPFGGPCGMLWDVSPLRGWKNTKNRTSQILEHVLISASGKKSKILTNRSRGEEVERKKSTWQT